MANAADALRAYHDATKHSVASVYGRAHRLDWDTMPRPFKIYPDIASIPLPRDFTSSTRPALDALAEPGDGPPLDRLALAHLLYFSAGILRRRVYPGGEMYFRAAACTGALYHIDLYLVCGSLPDLDAGVYHFGPHDFALARLRSGDHRAAVVAATAGAPAVAAAPVVVAFATTFWRNAWKYQARAYRHAFWDGGTLLANLLAVAAAIGLPARVVLGFVDADLGRLLDLDDAREATIGLVALGRGATPPPPAPEAPSLALATLPPSRGELDYPAIREAHAASSLESPAAVATWRAAADAAGPLAAPRTPLPAAVAEPVESVILRRGSTRVFARTPVDVDAATTILRAATRGIPADAHAPSDVYVAVHAVDGLLPGAYVFDRPAGDLRLLRAGDFRRDAGHLALGQALAADAAFDVFWLVDLAPVLARLGGRGYRVAQLEAAIEGGKGYLAAYALGLGATGLTFFDDDVTEFFSPDAAGKSVMFLIACGRPARRATR
jgi:SagB-type dehydrogenase family enzyme